MNTTIPLLAGFECGQLIEHGQDFLHDTAHTPQTSMAANYRRAIAAGMNAARDGLLSGHDPAARLAVAAAMHMDVWWDIHHFDQPSSYTLQAFRVAHALRANPGQFRYCAVNEPLNMERFTGMAPAETARLLRAVHCTIRGAGDSLALSVEQLHGWGEFEHHFTDLQVAAGYIDVVGVNYYPHEAQQSLCDSLLQVWRRYRLPTMVSETSWHCGHPEQAAKFPGIRHKGDWLAHVMSEVAAAVAQGVPVLGVCWYPLIDCSAWGEPGSGRWSHGLLRHNGEYDRPLLAELSAQLGPRVHLLGP